MSVYPETADLPEQASIVSRWLLDESSGSRADSVGSNTLTDNNTVTAGTGYSDAGASFDNAADFELDNSEYLSKGDNAGLSITGDMSASFLLNPESQPSGGAQMHIMTKRLSTGNQKGYAFRYEEAAGPTKLTLSISTDGSAEVSKGVETTLSNATWYLVSFAYDASAGSVDFYVNGAQVGSQQTGLPTSIFDNTADFNLGAVNNGAGSFWDGLMNDAILWGGVVLTSDNMSDLYDLYTTAAGIKGSPIFFT